jgi:murein DD-endopeptidase MepM/ murein hydrolase activator NlpD
MNVTALMLAVLALTGADASAQTAPQLELPLVCTLGRDCFLQQLTDVDPGPGAKDHRCGSATYPGHKGTDIRVLSTKAAEAGVPVIASAPGTVKGTRDGVPDRLVASAADRAAVDSIECGNGVVIDHGAGWETQYCHMRRGSVAVRKGQRVETGARLGLVGYSGDAQFAHVHLSVRRDGQIVDPFAGAVIDGSCQAGAELPAASLWSAGLRAALAYPDAAIIETGFAARPASPDEAETGAIAAAGATSPGLVFFARFINLRLGDSLQIGIVGPAGFAAVNKVEPLDRNKAHYIAFAGKMLRADRWPPGDYRGEAVVLRAGKVIGEAKGTLTLP